MGRAQERRELADLWPQGHFLPTILMKSRTINEKEREYRIEKIRVQQASLALGLEIRENVAQSKLWEVKFDDYGRQYYQHSKTGQTMEEEPEILSYKPPKGRDDMGNLLGADDSDKWTPQCDYKGQVFYRHNETGEVSYFPPEAYPTIPPGKSITLLVGEAAHLVLNFIRGKIQQNIDRLNPVIDAAEEKRRKKMSEEEVCSLDSYEFNILYALFLLISSNTI